MARTLDIEIAIMREFNIRKNLIVPNITNMNALLPFETDMLILSNSGYATGFEIKISKSDLKADLKKRQYSKFDLMVNGKFGLQRYYGKFKYFNYAVPVELYEEAIKIIHSFCGVWVYKESNYPNLSKFYCVRDPKKLFDYKWNDKQTYEVARLGAMRILTLKENIRSLIYQNKV